MSTSHDLFRRLTNNGLDFLARSIEEFNKYPKYSVIHFHAAVELFLKARLMAEHWSLVVGKRQEPDWDKFESGEFISVSLDEAADRLDKVVRNGLTNQELKAFRDVTKHRNKMVHFFHEAHTAEESEKLQRAIAREQLTAWYLLHRLLTTRWDDVFAPWAAQIAAIDSELRKLHDFLKVVFDHIKPDIQARIKVGEIFDDCPSCGFEARWNDSDLKTVYEAECLVCGLTDRVLRVECPDCGNIVTFVNEGRGECESCGKSFEPEDVADILVDSGGAHIAAMEGDYSWGFGNCSDCDGYHTVVRTEDDNYVCASCFGVFEQVGECGWCNEFNTGDMEDSFYTGCNFCDGRLGWEKDD